MSSRSNGAEHRDRAAIIGLPAARYRACVPVGNAVWKILWRATVDEDGHYVCAMALCWSGHPNDRVGKQATDYDIALRLMGRSPREVAGALVVSRLNPFLHARPGAYGRRSQKHISESTLTKHANFGIIRS